LPGEGEQFVIACPQMRARPWGHRHTALDQGLMDCRHTAVVAGTLLADEGQHVEATRVLRQGEAAFLFGAVRGSKVPAGLVETAPHLAGETEHSRQGGEGAIMMVRRPHRLATGGTVAEERLQGLGGRRERARGCPGHRTRPP
jgi:hypothetical protein